MWRYLSLHVLIELTRGLWDKFAFWLRHRWILLGSLVVALFSMILSLLDFRYNELFFIIGFVLSLLSTLLITLDVYKIYNHNRYFRFDKIGRSLLTSIRHKLLASDIDDILVEENWNAEKSENEAAVYSPYVNRTLDSASNPITPLRTAFKIKRPTLHEYAPLIRHHIGGRRNERKIRLCTDLTRSIIASAKPIEVQKTTYFDGLITNEFSMLKMIEKGGNIPVIDGSSLFVSNDSTLRTLLDSECSNHIGVSTLVITRDGKIPIGKQTKDSVGSPGRWAPTGSGSVDFADIACLPVDATFRDLLVYGMNREVEEESNLSSKQLTTHVVGYVRLLHRGGKPDFFGLSFTELLSSEVKIRNKEPLYMDDYVSAELGTQLPSESAPRLRIILEKYENKPESSFILLLSLKFASEFQQHVPSATLRES